MKGHSNRGAFTASAFIAIAMTGAVQSAEPSIRIDVRGMNLEDPATAAALYSRIQRSARLVCTDASSPWQAGRAGTINACVAHTVADALKQANTPQLTALHARESASQRYSAR
jgi:UrcA family protein